MAIWGLETSYGTVTGSMTCPGARQPRLLRAPPRFLRGRVRRRPEADGPGRAAWRLKGSWAGATGYPQFMPSVALRLRADGDGDGYADIWTNELDGLASIATYLRDAGWKPNVPWGIAVRTPTT